MDSVFYLYLTGSYTPVVAHIGTPGALVALALWMRRYRCSDGAFTEESDGWRWPQGQLFLFPESGLGLPLGTVVFTKGTLLPEKHGAKICARQKKVIYIQPKLAHHTSDGGRKGGDEEDSCDTFGGCVFFLFSNVEGNEECVSFFRYTTTFFPSV